MAFLTGMMKRSLENPSTPLSAPDDWLFDSLGSFRASSGVNVNRETALTQDTYWRCVALLSGDVAKLPLVTYRRDGKAHAEAEEHPAYPILRDAFCPEISALAGKRVLTFHALTEGNGYGYIYRNGDGSPREIWPLSPMKTYPVREDQSLWYVTEVGGIHRRIKAEDVFHLMGLSFDGLVGYSAVSKMRECLGMAIAAENFGSIFFRNNARPNVVLKHPGRLKPESKQALRESWERIHSGLENSHRTAVLEEGMDLVAFMHNARDSQLLELKGFSRLQICNFFGVPPHKAGDSSRTSYNSLEQENEGYIEDGGGLGWWLPAWEAEAWRKLLTEEEKKKRTHMVRFRTRQLLRANLGVRTQYYVQMVQNGILSPDEVREEEGYDPRPDGKGGDYVQPLNMGPAGQDPAKDPEPKTDPEPKPALPPPKKKKRWTPPAALVASHRQLIIDAAGRMVRRVGIAAERAAKKPGEFLAWIDSLESDHGDTIRAALGPAVTSSVALVGGDCTLDAIAADLIADLRARLLSAAGVATAGALPATVQALCERWPIEIPGALADTLLTRGKSTKPARTTQQALDILGRLPDLPDKEGHVALTMPVDETPPYDLQPADLAGASTKKVWIRELVGTRAEVERSRIADYIQDPEANVNGQDMGSLPTDRPYVIQAGDVRYIYDGHHRLMGDQLRGIAKVKVYLYKVKS